MFSDQISTMRHRKTREWMNACIERRRPDMMSIRAMRDWLQRSIAMPIGSKTEIMHHRINLRSETLRWAIRRASNGMLAGAMHDWTNRNDDILRFPTEWEARAFMREFVWEDDAEVIKL